MLKLQKLKQNSMHKHTAENILVDSFGSFASRVFASHMTFPWFHYNMTRGDEDIEGGLRKFLDTRKGGS